MDVQVRKAVQTQSIADLFCKPDEGIMYGNGEVWVGLTKFGWAIQAVYVDDGTGPGKRHEPSIKFVCRTNRHRIVVDVDPNDTLRYLLGT